MPWREEVQLSSGRVRLWGPRKKEYSGHSRGTKLPLREATAVSRCLRRGGAAPPFLGRPCIDLVSFLASVQQDYGLSTAIAFLLGHLCTSPHALCTLSEVKAMSGSQTRELGGDEAQVTSGFPDQAKERAWVWKLADLCRPTRSPGCESSRGFSSCIYRWRHHYLPQKGLVKI